VNQFLSTSIRLDVLLTANSCRSGSTILCGEGVGATESVVLGNRPCSLKCSGDDKAVVALGILSCGAIAATVRALEEPILD